jgi:septal ring factor EnvC (AmiA/AmiB activator)
MTTKGYKEKVQMLQQTIDKQEEEIIRLNNELLLCQETKKEYPKELSKGNMTATNMPIFEKPNITRILKDGVKAMKTFTDKKRNP